MGSIFYFVHFIVKISEVVIMGKDIVTNTKNILLIDDEPDIIFTIKIILEENGLMIY